MEISLSKLAMLLESESDPAPPSATDPWKIGKCYLIRTVTMIQVGRLIWFGDKELVLTNAAWIADTGRFGDCLKDPGVIKEAEPFVNDCIVGRGAIVDATIWHDVKVSQK